ncbi:hypothetical protein LOAG_17489 [Loa loa]|uniref:Uncharacterized protein n=1 Tax=Loa loa TaxID=7209 RepID=A0A1S0UIE2_LOALO|nr:hypothetical protein LOAG_17489 [Loa loa]EJD75345.1 hypothetical protein LOAG_17489 [Loa loa]
MLASHNDIVKVTKQGVGVDIRFRSVCVGVHVWVDKQMWQCVGVGGWCDKWMDGHERKVGVGNSCEGLTGIIDAEIDFLLLFM